jgi:hypothetical protein
LTKERERGRNRERERERGRMGVRRERERKREREREETIKKSPSSLFFALLDVPFFLRLYNNNNNNTTEAYILQLDLVWVLLYDFC